MAVQEANYWKIGLFVVTGMATALGVLFWLGAQRFARETIEHVTYFDESVQGLDVGAPVKMRGVKIGNVTDITLAPDHRLVQVTSNVYVDVMVRLNLGTAEELVSYTAPMPADLRVQLATTGITGVKFLLVDFFKGVPPPPTLSFEPHAGYIPSTPSTLKSLEDSFYSLASSLPETLLSVTALANTLERQVAAVDIAGMQIQVKDLIAHLDELLLHADRDLTQLDLPGLSTQVSADLDALLGAIRKADALLDQLSSAEGPVERVATEVTTMAGSLDRLVMSLQAELDQTDLAGIAESLQRAIDSYGTLAGEGTRVAGSMGETLLLLRETLSSVQALASFIERQPGALLRGRVEDPPRPKVR